MRKEIRAVVAKTNKGWTGRIQVSGKTARTEAYRPGRTQAIRDVQNLLAKYDREVRL